MKTQDNSLKVVKQAFLLMRIGRVASAIFAVLAVALFILSLSSADFKFTTLVTIAGIAVLACILSVCVFEYRMLKLARMVRALDVASKQPDQGAEHF